MLPEPLSLPRLRTALAGQVLGHEVQVLESCDSTNDIARDFGVKGYPHGLTIFAESQNAGRGRRSNQWLAPARKSLLMSILLRPKQSPAEWPTLTMTAALGICRSLDKLSHKGALLKWPNDVYIQDRKIAGLLAETVYQGQDRGFVVLGVGLNVNQSIEDFPPELRETASSLYLLYKQLQDRTALAIQLLRNLGELIREDAPSFTSLLPEIRERNFLLGKTVCAENEFGKTIGIAEDLMEGGSLILRLPNGQCQTFHTVDRIRRVTGTPE